MRSIKWVVSWAELEAWSRRCCSLVVVMMSEREIKKINIGRNFIFIYILYFLDLNENVRELKQSYSLSFVFFILFYFYFSTDIHDVPDRTGRRERKQHRQNFTRFNIYLCMYVSECVCVCVQMNKFSPKIII